jgi:hypothetical protein
VDAKFQNVSEGTFIPKEECSQENRIRSQRNNFPRGSGDERQKRLKPLQGLRTARKPRTSRKKRTDRAQESAKRAMRTKAVQRTQAKYAPTS